MSAINPAAAESVRASGPEAATQARPGGKKKNGNLGLAESLFAGILSQAREALSLRAALASRSGAATKATSEDGARMVGREAQPGATVSAKPPSGAAQGAATAAKSAAKRAAPGPGGPEKRPVGDARQSISSKRYEFPGRSARGERAEADAASAALAGASRAAGMAASPSKPALSGARGGAGEDGASGEADGAGKKAGGKGREARVSVLDLRRAARDQAAQSAKPEAAGAAAGSREESSLKKEIVRELGLGTAQPGSGERAARAEKPQAHAAASSDFSSMLADRLREAWNGEIVQAAHIVLKDGGAGTIRLKLRPESLGDVKIELNLSDKSMSGKIVVESDEAKSAFERNMAELADAFRQGGFESASLEVSVGSGSGKGAGEAGEQGPSPFFSERLRTADAVAVPAAAGVYARRGNAVDILA